MTTPSHKHSIKTSIDELLKVPTCFDLNHINIWNVAYSSYAIVRFLASPPRLTEHQDTCSASIATLLLWGKSITRLPWCTAAWILASPMFTNYHISNDHTMHWCMHAKYCCVTVACQTSSGAVTHVRPKCWFFFQVFKHNASEVLRENSDRRHVYILDARNVYGLRTLGLNVIESCSWTLIGKTTLNNQPLNGIIMA